MECFKIVCTDFDHVLEKSGKINQGGILFEGEYYLWSRKRFCPPPITWALIHIATTYIACANAMPPPRANEPLSCHRNRNQLPLESVVLVLWTERIPSMAIRLGCKTGICTEDIPKICSTVWVRRDSICLKTAFLYSCLSSVPA